MSLQIAGIAQNCKALRLPAVGAQFASLADEAAQRKHSHLHYLEALLQAEMEDRERRSIELRMKEAHLPRIKTLEEFDFAQSPHIPAARIRALAEGGYLERAEPVLLVGDPGTGKSHLATGLAIAACRQRKRVRFTTAAALVNQLVEAQREQSLSRMLARWSRVELIVIDELGYVPLAEVAAELLFQVIAERAEKAAIIVTTTCPSQSGPRSSPTPGSARPCSIALPIRHTSSRPAQSPIASVEPCGRRPKSKPWELGSASATPSGLRSSRTQLPQHQRPKGGPKQTAEVGQAKLPNS
ncbi:MAG TPA: IS21-like element helper ATPase IstB, partial [Terracidiphilus sp.]|nr:IS21-like element helper ATPase IstB [Terracidiphilus sp.]